MTGLCGGACFAAQAQGRAFLMAESPGYFEAHRHVLQALQRTDAQSVPFGRTLLELPVAQLNEWWNAYVSG